MPFVAGLQPEPGLDGPVAWFAFHGDRLLVQLDGDRVTLPDRSQLIGSIDPDATHYLGRLDGVRCFTLEVEGTIDPSPGHAFEGLRALFSRLDDDYFSIAGRAAQIVEWDRSHRFCGRCGEPTLRMETERARRCPRCGFLSFPRVTPAVIMRVERGDRVLLARNVNFVQGFYSVLAGFVEPGETLEEAVAREVEEEVSLEVRNIRYFGSQSWPFPHQLMLGFTADYAGGEIAADPAELAEAGWYTRDSLPNLPSKISIARRLIDNWLGQDSTD
jgi:NAD+ diphosphatase